MPCARGLITAALLITAAVAWGRSVRGESAYLVPETQSLYEARHAALVRARIEAIEKAFGSLVSMSSTTYAADGKVKFRSNGASEVRGIWLRDLSSPVQRVSWDDALGSIVIVTAVHGEVEELRRGRADVRVSLRRNCASARCESSEFTDGDNLYLSLRSSEPGYVAIFLMDDESMVHTMLPYTRDSRSCFPVSKGREYLFFDPSDSDALTDAYRLRTGRSAELCRLCVIFAQEPFGASASENFNGNGRARTQPFDEFDRWLTRLRRDNTETQILFQDIILKKQ